MAEARAAAAVARGHEGRDEQDRTKVLAQAGLPLLSFRALASIAVLSAVTLAADIVLPPEIWAAALHMAVVFLGVWLARAREAVALGAVATSLLVAGAILSLPAPAFTSAADALAALGQGPDLANRLMVLLGIWSLVAVLGGAKRREAALRARLVREAARRLAGERELERRHAVPRPAALPDRVRDDRDLGHEVRTHLNAIVGFSDAAKQEIYGPHSDPRYRDYLGHINEAGWALVEVFDRTLAAEPLPERESEPGARREPGRNAAEDEPRESTPAADPDPASVAEEKPKAVNQ